MRQQPGMTDHRAQSSSLEGSFSDELRGLTRGAKASEDAKWAEQRRLVAEALKERDATMLKELRHTLKGIEPKLREAASEGKAGYEVVYLAYSSHCGPGGGYSKDAVDRAEKLVQGYCKRHGLTLGRRESMCEFGDGMYEASVGATLSIRWGK